MTDLSIEEFPAEGGISKLTVNKMIMGALLIVALVIAFVLANRIQSLTTEDALLSDSTIGELAVWIADQSEEDEPASLLVQIAKASTVGGIIDAESMTLSLQNGVVIWVWGVIAFLWDGGHWMDRRETDSTRVELVVPVSEHHDDAEKAHDAGHDDHNTDDGHSEHDGHDH